MLTENEQSKLGSRQDRYGVFGTNGQADFDQVVNDQRKKVNSIDGIGVAQQSGKDWKPSKDEAKEVKRALGEALVSLGSRTDLKVEDKSDASPTASEVSSEFEDEDMGTGRSTPQSEDSTDKVPVKQAPEQRNYRAMFNQ